MAKRLTALIILVPLLVLALIWMHGNEQRLGDQTSEMICSLRPC
ncbi:hypothetical protein [Catenuloplanes japonicus]|nr:hypothetical protein [Catenuloplanes japonicus]